MEHKRESLPPITLGGLSQFNGGLNLSVWDTLCCTPEPKYFWPSLRSADTRRVAMDRDMRRFCTRDMKFVWIRF